MSAKNLRLRLIFLSILPIVIIFILSTMILVYENGNKSELETSQTYINEAMIISDVIHKLQLERGFSIAFLVEPNTQEDIKTLQEIRQKLDVSLGRFSLYHFKIFEQNPIKQELLELKKIREDVDGTKISTLEAKAYYTAMTLKLLDILKILPNRVQDQQIRNYMQSLSYLASAKESFGLIRAGINKTLKSHIFNEDDFHSTLMCLEGYRLNIHSFLAIANSDIDLIYKKRFHGAVIDETFDTMYRVLSIHKSSDFSVEPKYWFGIATQTIDTLRSIEDEIFKKSYSIASSKVETIFYKLLSIAIFLLLSILILATIITLMGKRILFNASMLEKERFSSNSLLEQYKASVDISSIVSKTDKEGIITYVNDELCRITGYTKEELIGVNHNILRHSDTPLQVYKDMWYTIKTLKKPWHGELKNRNKDGSEFWAKSFIYPILDGDEIVEYLATRVDITELVKQRSMFENIATTDALTGLYSRYKLQKDIENLKTTLSLAIINIDSFREINDFYGHYFGDKLIIKIANILKDFQKHYSNLTIYRVQGDEFAILALYNTNFVKIISEISGYIKLAKLEIDSQSIVASCSCGISFEDGEHLLSSANMALKLAKKSSSDLVIYTQDNSLNKEYENNIKYTKILASAIENDRLVAYYQPIINNATLKIEKYESLIRLIDEDKRVVSPFFFLDIAKKTRKYFDITKAIIKQSFEIFKDKECEFSINLSIKDIAEPLMREFILKSLMEYKFGNRVVFELVESESIESFELVNEFIYEIKKYGAKIAIDDFGTGYSNFEHLARLKADYLKIDGSLIKNIVKDDNTYLVVSTIVQFAKKLGMKTIAEFVEDQEIFEATKELGIDFSQGYFFGEPRADLL